jgi:hypothetical protein
MINAAWNMDGKKVTTKGWSGEYWASNQQKCKVKDIL